MQIAAPIAHLRNDWNVWNLWNVWNRINSDNGLNGLNDLNGCSIAHPLPFCFLLLIILYPSAFILLSVLSPFLSNSRLVSSLMPVLQILKL
jgi:hypothetical protein